MKALLSRPYAPLLLVGLGLILGLLVFSLSQLQDLSHPVPQVSESLALLDEAYGDVSVLDYGSTQPRTVSSDSRETALQLHHLDLLQTGKDSQVIVKFPSGYELKVEGSSQLLFEAWGGDPKAPTYIHMISGSYSMQRAGQRGRVLIQQDRKLIYPEGRTAASPYQLVIQATGFEFAEDGNLAPTMESDEAPEILPAPAPSDASSELPQTLSNEEIDQVLASHRLQFERCQTNALRENQPAQGKILIGITISSEGRMEEVRVISSELNNASFQNCIVSVFQRARFRAFKGPAITRSYPLIFD